MVESTSDLDEEEGGPKITFGALLRAYWMARHLVIVIVAVTSVLAIVYALILSEPVYVAKAMIGPVDSGGNAGSGAKQALSALAGIDLGSIGSGGFNKFTEVLGSAQLADRLQKKYNVMPLFFGGWNSQTRSWTPPSGPIADAKNAVKVALGRPSWKPPTVSDLSDQLNGILTTDRVAGSSPLDLKNQITIVTLKYKDPEIARQLLTEILLEADAICRDDQLRNSSSRITYLTRLMNETQEVTLRDGLRQLLINEEQTFVSLSANKYYSVDMIDPPNVSSIPVGMPASKKILIGIFAGFVLSIALVYLLLRNRVSAASAADEMSDVLREPFPDPFAWPGRIVRGSFGQPRSERKNATNET